MEQLINALLHALDPAATVAPEWLQLLPAKEFTGADGRGPYAKPDMDALIAAFTKDGVRLPVDENHSTDLAAKQGHSAPARGWIVELQARPDGLWGRVDWTPTGKQMVEDHEYGFISPVFAHTRTKPFKIAKMLRVALTNDPNLPFLKSLHSKQEHSMLEELRKALGLPETADEAAILAAVASAHAAQQAHAGTVAAMGRIALAAGVAANASPDAIVIAINAKAPATGTAAEVAELRNQLTSLNTQYTTLVTSHAKDRAVTVVDAGIKAGKIVPALRDHMIERHTKDPASVEKEIELMPSLNAGGLGNRTTPANTDPQLSVEDDQVIAQMGFDPKAFADAAKALHGKGV
ncbi:phage protease [Rhizobium mayense]|uniref:Phage protease n=1 Tax=Rhizobium mayense TaxID=1312184 RepID=A0ABT7JY27_9HYPH|nr:phage protease [Rhizobium mayense]MDL2401259.1 phage protease [Rhizobium mayense]